MIDDPQYCNASVFQGAELMKDGFCDIDKALFCQEAAGCAGCQIYLNRNSDYHFVLSGLHLYSHRDAERAAGIATQPPPPTNINK